MIGFFSTPPPALQAAPDPMTLAELEASVVSSGSTESLQTDAFTPPAGALCVVVSALRRDAARTFAAPSATHNMEGSWASWVTHYPIDGVNYLGLAIHARRWSASPGSGTVTQATASGNVYQMHTAVLSIGGAAASPLIRSGSANNNSGSTLAVPYSNSDAPPADMQGLVAVIQVSDNTAAAISGYTTLHSAAIGSSLSFKVLAKNGDVANTVSITGMASVFKAGVNAGVAHG